MVLLGVIAHLFLFLAALPALIACTVWLFNRVGRPWRGR
jgi:hypothetical protein